MDEPQTLRHSHLTDRLLWLLGQRRRLRVVGRSMLPLLQPGEEVLIDPSAYGRGGLAATVHPCPGDLVVARPPHQPDLRIVKWVVFVEADGRCYLKGLNPQESTDSRHFGLVPRDAILGQVMCRFP